MKVVSIHGLAMAVIFCCSSVQAHDIQREDYETKHDLTAFSETKLKEIFIWGLYVQEDPREVEKIGEWYRVIAAPHRRAIHSNDLPQFREKEELYSSSGMIFCLRDTNQEIKEMSAIFDPSLRVRLYNKEGKVVSEDFLRDSAFDLDNPGPYERAVVSYIPHREEGHKLRIVQLASEGETVIATLAFYTLEVLRAVSIYLKGYSFSGDCYASPETRSVPIKLYR